LIDGKGDIAAANLTITAERSAAVDFAKPWSKDVKEILVTGPSAPSIASISDLGGKEVMVRISSSYYTHLVELNERLEGERHATVKIVPADENLEDEDVLQMVNAGLLPWAFIDAHTAIVGPYPEGPRASRGFSVERRRRDCLGNSQELPAASTRARRLRYGARQVCGRPSFRNFYAGNVVRNALAPPEIEKFRELIGYFKTYGEQHGIDPYILAAQGYQESSSIRACA
jgi:hypothetical protein